MAFFHREGMQQKLARGKVKVGGAGDMSWGEGQTNSEKKPYGRREKGNFHLSLRGLLIR